MPTPTITLTTAKNPLGGYYLLLSQVEQGPDDKWPRVIIDLYRFDFLRTGIGDGMEWGTNLLFTYAGASPNYNKFRLMTFLERKLALLGVPSDVVKDLIVNGYFKAVNEFLFQQVVLPYPAT